jgi:carboxypeptidase D
MLANGPFIWQPGTLKPVENAWSWTKLTNVVWIDQPIGSGFSVGDITARDEADVAKQFMGFWKNFIDTYSMQGYKVYVTGSSYSGMYCPYIASAMLDANDKTYFDVSGMLIFDGVYSLETLSEDLPVVAFHDSWERVFNFNDTFKSQIRAAAQKCGYQDYLTKYLAFPPAGVQPSRLPGTEADGSFTTGCDIFNSVFLAALDENPCFSPYEIFHRCPRPLDPLGFSDGTGFVPDGFGPLYLNRSDVKAAINAPVDQEWVFCSSMAANGKTVFVNGTDLSLAAGPGSQPVIPNVIDKTQNVIIGHGARDFVLIADGTLLAIQNLTWGGKLGFQEKPSTPLIMPELSVTGQNAIGLGITTGGGAGVVGTVHSERGLTYLGVEAAGHFLIVDSPEVAFRSVEVLLGRVDGFQSVKAFTTDAGATSSSGLGNGTRNGAAGGTSSSQTKSNVNGASRIDARGVLMGLSVSLAVMVASLVM